MGASCSAWTLCEQTVRFLCLFQAEDVYAIIFIVSHASKEH